MRGTGEAVPSGDPTIIYRQRLGEKAISGDLSLSHKLHRAHAKNKTNYVSGGGEDEEQSE